MNTAKEILNPLKRINKYEEIQKKIVDEHPWISLYHPQVAIATNTGVFGARLNPLGIVRFEDIVKE
jgi:ABC-type transport system substrate-binding protein